MRGQTLEQLLSTLPSTTESIEKIRETVKELEKDIETSGNEERKRIQRLNILTCLKRIKEIEKWN